MTGSCSVGDVVHGGTDPMIIIPDREAVDLEIVIPALNEEKRIGRTIDSIVNYLRCQPYRAAIVVVDNGCVDGTTDVVIGVGARSPVPIHLINCSRRGKGAAVRRGVLSSQARHVGFCDADLATPIQTLDFVWPLLERGARVVVGSRRSRGAKYLTSQPWNRRLGGWAFRILTHAVVPNMKDTQCGFKFFNRGTARYLFSQCRVDGFAFDVEILALARSAGLMVYELPVNWSDCEGSTFRPMRDGISSIADVLRITWSLRHPALAPRTGGVHHPQLRRHSD